MFTPTFARTVACFALAAAAATPALARPIFMHFEGIDGSCTSNSSMERAIVGGQSVVDWHTSTGPASLVFRPNAANAGRPMESLALNYTKISFQTVPMGSHVEVADDVMIDGRIITAAVWARWTKTAGEGVRIDFGKSPEAAGVFDVTLKRGSGIVHTYTCTGVGLECDPWFLSVTCPELECSIMCPSLCGIPSTSRPDPDGGVAIDLPLPRVTSFAVNGGAVLSADAISVRLRPGRTDPAMTLAGTRLFVSGLPGLRINSAVGTFACPADFNGSGTVTVQDIFDFLSRYFAGSPLADFNNSGALSVQDIFDFLAAYFAGCP